MRKPWMDKVHEFRENVNDGSMCLCGIPAYYHEDWETRMSEESERVVIGTPATGGQSRVVRRLGEA